MGDQPYLILQMPETHFVGSGNRTFSHALFIRPRQAVTCKRLRRLHSESNRYHGAARGISDRINHRQRWNLIDVYRTYLLEGGLHPSAVEKIGSCKLDLLRP